MTEAGGQSALRRNSLLAISLGAILCAGGAYAVLHHHVAKMASAQPATTRASSSRPTTHAVKHKKKKHK